MAKVTGFLSDFQLGHLGRDHPTVVFQPSGPALSSERVFAPGNITVTPVGDTGYFEADLQPTDVLLPVVYYRILVQWGRGQRVYLPWPLSVPSAGGSLADLLRVASNPALAFVNFEPPTDPTPGTWWLDPTTGELAEWSD